MATTQHGQKLVIVESPAKAKTIEKFLGKGYKVEASQGHVRDLPKSQIGVDPTHDFAMKYITIRGRGDILARIRKEAKGADVIYLATDPDREGEAISWHLANVLDIDTAQKCRIEFHEITKKAVKDAISHPRAIDMDRVDAQQARRALDRLVGYKISPLLWAKIKKGLSAGRVQSVATRLVVDREREIEAFIPEEYWDVTAKFEAPTQKGRKVSCDAKLVLLDGKKAVIRNEAEAKAAKKRILNADFTVSQCKLGEKLKRPQPPFTTSSLQQEASRKLNFSTAKTMQVVQQLYEGIDLGKAGTVGLVTYIRTDSVRVSEEAVTAARGFIQTQFGDEYCPEKPNQYKGRKNAQDAHEAIRPTYVDHTPDSVKAYLTKEQFNLYRLIYTRFLASQMKPAVFQTLTADLSGGGAVLRYYGEHMTFAGYRAVYIESTDDEQETPESILPVLEEGGSVNFTSVNAEQHFTQPPARYTEASLVRTLEEKGIGRPSTYNAIITTIVSRNYVTRDGKSLVPTTLGELTTRLMKENFPDLVDYAFTAQMETELDEIEKGEADMKEVLSRFWADFSVELDKAQTHLKAGSFEIPVEKTDLICEKCGAQMVVKEGRYGKFAACPNYPACRNTKPLTEDGKAKEEEDKVVKKPPVVADFKCELCGADMVQRTGRYGTFFACSNYPTCRFTKQKVKELDVPCPKCGAKILIKTGRNKTVFYSCERYPECDFSSWDMPTAEKCPRCGQMLFRKKGKPMLLCHNKDCGYRVETEDTEAAGEKSE